MKHLTPGLRLLRRAATVSFVVLAPALVARADHKDNPSPNHDAAGAPIDGGASVLLAGGVAYAVRRVRQARKKA